MARTTITIDTPLYRKIKDLSAKEHKTITRVISDLLQKALTLKSQGRKARPFKWHSRNMGARIDYRDKEALYNVLDKR